MDNSVDEAEPPENSVHEPALVDDKPAKQLGVGRLLLLLGVIWVTEIFLGAAITIAYYAGPGEAWEMPPFLWMLPITVVGWCTTLFFCALIGIRPYHQSYAEGFGIRALDGKIVARAALLGIGYSLVSMTVSFLFIDESEILLTDLVAGDEKNYVVNMAAFMVFAMIVAPIEELYYRGFLFQAFRGILGTIAAAVLMIVWFTAIHAFQLAGSVAALLMILGLSLGCMILRLRYDSVLPAIAFHWTYNLVLVLVSLVSLLIEGA